MPESRASLVKASTPAFLRIKNQERKAYFHYSSLVKASFDTPELELHRQAPVTCLVYSQNTYFIRISFLVVLYCPTISRCSI